VEEVLRVHDVSFTIPTIRPGMLFSSSRIESAYEGPILILGFSTERYPDPDTCEILEIFDTSGYGWWKECSLICLAPSGEVVSEDPLLLLGAQNVN
jgi:hypothetical protein